MFEHVIFRDLIIVCPFCCFWYSNSWDWLQNLVAIDVDIHKDNDTTQPDTCTASFGFATFLASSVGLQALEDAGKCVEDYCTESNKRDCLTLTGHSKGGAQATIASIVLHKYNPTVITFGGAPAVSDGCQYVPSDRTFRFFNTIRDPTTMFRVIFDAVPFIDYDNIRWLCGKDGGEGVGFPDVDTTDDPELAEVVRFMNSAEAIKSTKWFCSVLESVGKIGTHYGHAIVLGEDEENTRYFGYDADTALGSDVQLVLNTGVTPGILQKAHDPELSRDRIRNLMEVNTPTIGAQGFRAGKGECDFMFPDLCKSGRCDKWNRVCLDSRSSSSKSENESKDGVAYADVDKDENDITDPVFSPRIHKENEDDIHASQSPSATPSVDDIERRSSSPTSAPSTTSSNADHESPSTAPYTHPDWSSSSPTSPPSTTPSTVDDNLENHDD
jgi:Lipase (class 3)